MPPGSFVVDEMHIIVINVGSWSILWTDKISVLVSRVYTYLARLGHTTCMETITYGQFAALYRGTKMTDFFTLDWTGREIDACSINGLTLGSVVHERGRRASCVIACREDGCLEEQVLVLACPCLEEWSPSLLLCVFRIDRRYSCVYSVHVFSLDICCR